MMKDGKMFSRDILNSSDHLSIPLLENDEIEENRAERLLQKRNRFFKERWFCLRAKRLPLFLIGVCVLDIFLFFYSIYLNHGFEPLSLNPFIGPKPSILDTLGAKNDNEILHHNQWWRLFTPIFLHVGLIHLLVNLFFQIRIGLQLERFLGSFIIALVYIISGIGGNLASAIFLPHLLSVGASGSLFGLIGLILLSTIKNWRVYERPHLALLSVLIVVLVNLAIGLLPFVDNFCHLGGLFCGLCLACIVLPVFHLQRKDLTNLPMDISRNHSNSVYSKKPSSLCLEKENSYIPSISSALNRQKAFRRTMILKTENSKDNDNDNDEHVFLLVYESRCSFLNGMWVLGGLIGLLLFFISGFYVFYRQVDINEWCSWCTNLNCIQAWNLCQWIDQESVQGNQ